MPLWARATDVVAVIFAAAGLSVVAFGGFRVALLGVVITADDAIRPLAISVVLFVLRHLKRRTPSQAARISRWIRAFVHADSVRAIAPVFLWSRAGVLLVAALSVSTFGLPGGVSFSVSPDALTNLPARWDAGWYLGLAADGYEYDPTIRGQQNVAFFPAFPTLMHAAGIFNGGHATAPTTRKERLVRLLWGGVVINLAALAAALGYLFRMVRGISDRDTALAAVCFALSYPTAFVYNVPYTEGLFLLASVATFYHFGRGGLAAAAFWGTLAGLTRPTGFLLAIPLVAIALARSGPFPHLGPLMDRLNTAMQTPRSLRRDLAAAFTPIVGMLLFSAYLYAFWGDPFLWMRLHAAWGRTYQGLQPLVGSIETMTEGGLYGYAAQAGYELLQVLPFMLLVGLSVPIARRLGLAYTLLIVVTVIPPLLAGGWLSMARITVTLFPIYIILALVIPPTHRAGLIVLFALLQGLGASLFFTWRPFY